MKNNEHKQITRANHKCTDLFYLIATTLFVTGLLTYAIVCFNWDKLRDLSMPRDVGGRTCAQVNLSHPVIYLDIEGPSIENRSCTNHCQESQPNMQLGGICLNPRTKQILQQTGEYSQYLSPKLNTLNRFKIISIAVAASIVVSLLIVVVISGVMRCCQCGRAGSTLVIWGSVVAGGGCLFLLWKELQFGIWIGLCTVFGFYVLYVIVWRVCRSSNSLSKSTKLIPHNIFILPTIFLTILTQIIILGLASLLIFQYLAFISQSPYYSWKSPAIYAEVTGLTWRQMLVLVQAVYFISFTSVIYQYFIGSLYSSNLGLVNVFYSLFCGHFGSVCKLALMRIVLFGPIFLLTLAKPLQGQKCAGCCHCLCGWLLNFTRKYSLPVLAYQTAMKQSISLSQAADRLHYQSHINKMQYSEGYIEKMAIYAIIASTATITVLFYQKMLQLPLSLITLGLSIVLALWFASVFASSWIYAKQSQEVRRLCELNRDQSVV